MGITLKNNAKTTLSSGISSTDTTIPVTDTSSFPALGVGDYFYCTIESTTGTQEIVKVTQVNNTNFLATRAQEGTIAIPFATGARVELRITVQSLEDQFGVAVPAAVDDYIDTLPILFDTDIGVTVQAYDANTAKTDEANIFTAAQVIGTGTAPQILAFNTPASTFNGSYITFQSAGIPKWSLGQVSGVLGDGGTHDPDPVFYNNVNDGMVYVAVGGVKRALLKTSDIGTSVQAYDADTAKLDVAQDWSAIQTFNYGVHVGEPDSSTPATFVFERNGLHRWSMRRDTATESGADAGSNLQLWSHDDSGNVKSLIYGVTRSTGVLNFSIQPTISGSAILKASDIGVTVQGYDADTAKLDVAQTWTANQSFNTAIRPTTNDLAALGTSTLGWSDLWLADGGGIVWNNSLSLYHSTGKLAISHSGGALTLSLYRTDTPVGTQTGGITSYEGLDQAGNFQQYGRQYCFHATTVNGSETGWFVWSLASAGSLTDRMQMTPSVLRPATNDAMSLGDATLSWSDLFLASGAVINFNNGDVLITHSTDTLAFTGASTAYTFDAVVRPSANDAAALGSATVSWADLFLASGGVINFNNGDVLLTHGSDSLTLSGGRLNVQQGISGANPSILVTQDNDTAQPIVAVFQGDRATPTNGDSAVIALRLSDSAGNQDTAAQIQWGLGSVTSGAETGYMRFALVSSGTLTNRLDIYNTNLSPVFDDGLSLGTTSNKWADLFLASGAVINFNNGDVLITHSTDTLAFTGASTAYTFDAVVRPSANDAAALGSATVSWADLFLASGGVINFNNGNATLTHSTGLITSNVPFTATSTTAATAVFRALNNNNAAAVCAFRFEGDRSAPAANDAVYTDWVLSDSAGNQDIMGRIQVIGTTVTSGSEISLFRFSMVTLGVLTNSFEMTPGVFRPGTSDSASLGGASVHWSDLFLASGAVINFNNGNATLTHSAGRIASNVPIGLPSYTVAGLPAGSTGDVAYASDGRKNGEGAGLGTGVMVFKDATAWRACDTGATVAA